MLDLLGTGGVVSVNWFGAIVAGPHAGKAPPPYNVQPNRFFLVGPEQCRNQQGVIIADRYFVDLEHSNAELIHFAIKHGLTEL